MQDYNSISTPIKDENLSKDISLKTSKERQQVAKYSILKCL